MVAMGYVTTLPGDLHQDKLTMCYIKCTADHFYWDVPLSEMKKKKKIIIILVQFVDWKEAECKLAVSLEESCGV